MSLIQLDIQLSSDKLLAAIEQLDTPELDTFLQALLAVKAKRQAPVLPHTESELLQKINQGLSETQQTRHNILIQKRAQETLTPTEHQELLDLNQQTEALNVERMKYLIQLAQLRQIPLPQLINNLDLTLPTNNNYPS